MRVRHASRHRRSHERRPRCQSPAPPPRTPRPRHRKTRLRIRRTRPAQARPAPLLPSLHAQGHEDQALTKARASLPVQASEGLRRLPREGKDFTPDIPSSASSLQIADPSSAASYQVRPTSTLLTAPLRLCRSTCTHCLYRPTERTCSRCLPHPGASDPCSICPRRPADLSATRPAAPKRHRFFEARRSQPQALHRQCAPASIPRTIHSSDLSSTRNSPHVHEAFPGESHLGSVRSSSCLPRPLLHIDRPSPIDPPAYSALESTADRRLPLCGFPRLLVVVALRPTAK